MSTRIPQHSCTAPAPAGTGRHTPRALRDTSYDAHTSVQDSTWTHTRRTHAYYNIPTDAQSHERTHRYVRVGAHAHAQMYDRVRTAVYT